MMFRAIALPIAFAVFAVAFAGEAEAERRWFVDAAGVIIAMTDDPGGHTLTGTVVVLDSTIRMANPPGLEGDILWGGTWIAGVYTAPTGIVVAIDPTTDIGGVQTACKNMLDTFEAALDYISDNRLAWQHEARAKARDGIHRQIINSARVALNSTRMHASRQRFCEESASWPTGLSGDAVQYVDAMGADGVNTPSKDWSWVNPTTAARNDVGGAANGFGSATNVEDAPGSDKLIGRGWIRDIP